MCSRQSDPSRNTERRAAVAGGFVCALVFAAALVRAQAPVPPSGVSVDVGHYAVELALDVAAATISGRERIDLGIREPTSSLVFDCGALVVDSVESGGALPFVQRARYLVVTLPVEARAGERRRLDIGYHGAPRTGLTLLAASAQAYTTFSTSQWMVAVDSPADRATLDLEVTMPAGWKAAGSGRQVTRTERGGRTLYRWHQDREVPSYTFGFVAGSFREAAERHRGLTLSYLGGASFPEGDLRRIFRDTPAMIDFFEDRAGVRYPGDAYVQALVPVSGGQELAGLAHMSEAYGRSVLADSAATSLIAHELAHQWWGNLVTNRDWTHFWLNEGFATFMAAAYKERVRGRDAYLADVEVWQKRVEQLRAAGADKPLVFPDWNRPSADDRAVVYQKGALVLHELRELLGDAPFWTAVRSYTQRQAGQAVMSTDLQHAFEASSGRELSSFFNERVYLR
jgi:aminopeptidase N